MATVKGFKAEVLSVSPSSDRMTGSFRWPIYIINSNDNSKLPCYTLPPTQHHSFFRNSHPLCNTPTWCICWRTNLNQLCIKRGKLAFPKDSSTSFRTKPNAAASGMVRKARRKLLAYEPRRTRSAPMKLS